MKKYIFTESQIKKIIDNQIQEQKSKMIPVGGSAEGMVKMINGKTMVVVTGEMTGGTETIGPFNFKYPIKNGQGVFVANENGTIVIYGPNPKTGKGPNVRYN